MNAHARRIADRMTFTVSPRVEALFWTLLTVFIGWVLTTAWTSKEDVAAHNADVQAVRSDIQRVLDVVCDGKPTARACSTPPTPRLP